MTKDEFKALLLFKLLSKDIEKDILWISMDKNGEVWGFEKLPTIHDTDVNEESPLWGIYDGSTTGIAQYEHYIMTVEIDFDWRESLLSIEELFDD